MRVRPLGATLLAAALVLASACSTLDLELSSHGEPAPTAEGAWQTPGAGHFVEAGDLAVAPVPSEEAGLLDVMAVTADGKVAWRSTVPPLTDDRRIVTYETHRPRIDASDDVVVLHHYLEGGHFAGMRTRTEALTAFDARTGAHLWTDRDGASRVEAVTEEHLVVAVHDGRHLLAVRDPRTGRDRGVRLGRPSELGTFLMGTTDGIGFLMRLDDRGTHVTAHDLTTGERLWRTRTERPTNEWLDSLSTSSFAGASSGRALLQVRGDDGKPDRVELRDARTGRVLSSTGLALSSAATHDPDSDVVVLHGGGVDPLEPHPLDAMSAVDLTTGEVLWHVPAHEAQDERLMLVALGAGRLWVERDVSFFTGDVRQRPTTYEQTPTAPPRGDIILERFDSPLDGPPETIPDLE